MTAADKKGLKRYLFRFSLMIFGSCWTGGFTTLLAVKLKEYELFGGWEFFLAFYATASGVTLVVLIIFYEWAIFGEEKGTLW